MSDHITEKQPPEKAPAIFKWVNKEGGGVIPGVAARDLTIYDLASYSAEQRFAIDLEAKRDGGAYTKVGTVPKGLSLEPEAPVAPDADAEPAAKSGKKG